MIKQLVVSALSILGIAFSISTSAQLSPFPPNISLSASKPMMMLNMSRDHQLFYRAYDEFSDLDGDSLPESTYKHSFNYYGYFDSFKCYQYNSTDTRFAPASVTADKYCTNAWSGNFLNWASMARIDVVRKVLFGGYRSTDTASSTVLERTHLPTDAHSFAKYYKGIDLPKLTPFSAAQLAPTRARDNNDVRRVAQYDAGNNKNYVYPPAMVPAGAPTGSCQALVDAYYTSSATIAPDNYNCVFFNTGSNFDANFTPIVGDQIRAVFDQINNNAIDETEIQAIRGLVVQTGSSTITLVVTPEGFTGTSTAVQKDWLFNIVSQTSATMCNTTLGSGDSSNVNYWSHTNTNPPLIRIARGDFQLWNANERWQCYWNEEKSAANGNNLGTTGLPSGANNPVRATAGVTVGGAGPDFVARVEVCNPLLLGNERCQKYPSNNYKPIGLLQEYGEPDLAEFALMTGSYRKNISGGVIRSNMQSFRNEVNYTTDGTFTGTQGIVHNLNRLRIYGYDYDGGGYLNDNGCTYQLTGLTDNQCASWGNPLGEMFLESLNYLAGKAPTAVFDFTLVGSQDSKMGLSKPTWIDPFLRSSTAERATIEAKFGKAQCRNINVLNFNASVISYDGDGLNSFANLPGSPNITNIINNIGIDELIANNSFFVGNNGTTNDRICTAKNITDLAGVRGICPDGPAYSGSYSLAGLAHWAHTNTIRTDIPTSASAGPDANFKVKSYSVSLSPGKPRILVPNPSGTSTVVIQPAYMLRKPDGGIGGGTLVDFRIVEQTPTKGKYLVVWEDSEQGGDYDQDASGILRYEVKNGKLYVYSRTFAAATANPQGFGYTISGTNKDGVHFHSGIINFSFTDSTNITVTPTISGARTVINASGGCADCRVNDPETFAVYDFSSTPTAGILQDPMWLAAKWGGFKDGTTPTGKPDNVSKWDTKKADGTLGSDGIPDNYFLAFRADQLEKSLRTVFDDAIKSGTTAPAIAATQLSEGSLKYVVKFDSADGHGEVSAFAANAAGEFSTTPKWQGHELLTASSGRQIITNVTGTTAVAFTWSAMPNDVKSATFGGLGADAQARLSWVRGDRANEAPNGYRFKTRNQLSIMGSVVNSNPVLQRRPGSAFIGDTSYTSFIQSNQNRTATLWIGANDGMLHAFNGTDGTDGGKPLFSYLPGPLLGQAAAWSNPAGDSVISGMDGSPLVGDVKVGSNWATYLFSSLGRGGRGVFALDVTNPYVINEAGAASLFKWQFTAADDSDIGYILSGARATSPFTFQAGQIAKMNNGKFAVLFGNGYQSPGGKAVLYVLYVDGPTSSGSWGGGRFVKLVADSAGGGNGLSQPMWIDDDGNGTADFIYAGDLKGNMWKFDVSDTLSANWKVAFENQPLYTAKQADASPLALSITGAPRFGYHPFGGQVIVFATGKAVVTGDFPDSSRTNGIFGIWDNPGFVALTGAALTTALPQGYPTLATRTYVVEPSGAYITGGAIDWGTKKGWSVRFPDLSEASLANVDRVGDLLAITSLVPGDTTGATCSASAKAYVTFIDPVLGLLNQNIIDVPPPTCSTPPCVVKPPKNRLELPIGDTQVTFAAKPPTQCTTPPCSTTPPPCVDALGVGTTANTGSVKICQGIGRLSWREIPTFKTD